MSAKRKYPGREEAPTSTEGGRKARKGFTVGPDNLPDGTYRRKAQKIKSNLIHKAKVKKSYAKLKEREQSNNVPMYNPYATSGDAEVNRVKSASPTLEIHPQRQQMLDQPPMPSDFDEPECKTKNPGHSKPHSKSRPFANESQAAQQKREEAETRRRAIEESKRHRDTKIADRERMRRMTAAARKPDRSGQRRLGRESKVLLEKVKKLIGD